MDPTFEVIESTALSSNTDSVIFSSIPQTYDDLVLLASARSTRSPATTAQLGVMLIKPNDSTSNLSQRYVRGNGSSAISATDTTFAHSIAPDDTANWTANTYSSVEVYFHNYAGSTLKSIHGVTATETDGTHGYIYVISATWSSTSAITSIHLSAGNDLFKAGSTFYLYGITKA